MRHAVKKRLQRLVLFALLLLAAACTMGLWWLRQSLPQREGALHLQGLSHSVSVRYDERGVPHIRAENEADLYRALGFVHAQDRLFQMEMIRRLAQGELAEVLGEKLLETDKLFRTLGLRRKADEMAAKLDATQPATAALHAYLDGINQFQAQGRLPPEFKLLGIQPRPFEARDSLAVTGYLAYSFAAAFRTEPVMTYIRDQLGAAYLRIFDDSAAAPTARPVALDAAAWRALGQIAKASTNAAEQAGLPMLEGSNAWVIAGPRTASGKPLLAGDPHITFSLPSVWYEAHLSAPGFELYGHHQALSPFALLGHNQDFGWTLTMFQNDDVDFVAEKLHPQDAQKVWHQGQWVQLQTRTETIRVKNAADVSLELRQSPHGPWITDAFRQTLDGRPVALWWTFLESDNPVLEAFYRLNRAGSLAQARDAARLIHAPGLNLLWAHRDGNIAWWAAGRLPQRPAGVDPRFILDAGRGEAEKPGFLPFADNPQEENPARGYIVSANQRPALNPTPGYYNLDARARRLNAALSSAKGWDTTRTQALQQDTGTAYGPQLVRLMAAVLQTQLKDPRSLALLAQLSAWDGSHPLESTPATLFHQLIHEVASASLRDELPEPLFESLLKTRAIDTALPRLLTDADSPWWDNRRTPEREDRSRIVRQAWDTALRHLGELYGPDASAWTWGRAHTLTHGHPLGKVRPLDWLLNVGPFEMPGAREVPANFAAPLGPAPWKVNYGPSTRRVIDFGAPGKALGINPVGQSGVPFDRHYHDQAPAYHLGQRVPQHLLEADVAAHSRSLLRLKPTP